MLYACVPGPTLMVISARDVVPLWEAPPSPTRREMIEDIGVDNVGEVPGSFHLCGVMVELCPLL